MKPRDQLSSRQHQTSPVTRPASTPPRVADAAEGLVRLWRLLMVIHGDGATAAAISAAFDDLFGDGHPLDGLGDEQSGARTMLGRLLGDLESVGFTLDQQVDRSGAADRVRYRLRGAAVAAPVLSADEQDAVNAAAAVAQSVAAGAVQLWAASSTGAAGRVDEPLVAFATAIRDRTVVSFAYSNGRRREVHPYTLVVGPRGRWFVGGWCRHAEAVRTFPISELRDVQAVAGRTFRAPEPGDLAAADDTNRLLWEVNEPVTAQLQFAASTSPEVLEAFGLPLGDGSSPAATEYLLTVTNTDWLLRLVAAHWPQVRLAGPPALVDEFVARLNTIGTVS